MRTSAEQIAAQAAALDFERHAIEKVARLLELLDGFAASPLLRRHLALKGGTALNLFLMNAPRLSVDIDMNLIGADTRDELDELRPSVEAALEAVFASQDLDVRRKPDAHAGGKWSLRYNSAFGQGGQLEVDVNTLHRVPLWEPVAMPSRLPVFSQRLTLLQDVHEIVAGKLAALIARGAGRDLFDAHRLLSRLELDPQRLRLAFVVMGAQDNADWRELTPDAVRADPRELRSRLLPLLRRGEVPGVKAIDSWIEKLIAETRAAMGVVLPLTDRERAFLAAIHETGQIQADLLTTDSRLANRIAAQPGLLWKTLNVRRHRGLGD